MGKVSPKSKNDRTAFPLPGDDAKVGPSAQGETSKATAAAAAAKLRRVQRSNVIFEEECGGEELDVREGGAPMAARKKKEHNAMCSIGSERKVELPGKEKKAVVRAVPPPTPDPTTKKKTDGRTPPVFAAQFPFLQLAERWRREDRSKGLVPLSPFYSSFRFTQSPKRKAVQRGLENCCACLRQAKGEGIDGRADN